MNSIENIQLCLAKWGRKIVKDEQRIIKKPWLHRDGETKPSVITGKLLDSVGYMIEEDKLICEYDPDVKYSVYVDKGRTYNNGYHFKGIHFSKAEKMIQSDEFKNDFQKAFLKDFIKDIQQNKYK